MLTFNAVIEGLSSREPHGLTYKLANLVVPKWAVAIEDRKTRFDLVGVAGDFGKTFFAQTLQSGPVFVTRPLDFCEGLVLPYDGIGRHYLDEPRTVYLLEEGRRVFTKMGEDPCYMTLAIPDALKVIKDIISQKENSRLFRTVVLGKSA